MEPRVITGRTSDGNPAMRAGCIAIAVIFFVVLLSAKWAASLLIEYSWWKEAGQVKTWLDLYAYSTLPVVAGTVLAWIALMTAHGRAVHFAGGRVSDYRVYSRLSALVLLVLSFFIAGATIDNWTVLRFAGSRGMSGAGTFQDPIFHNPATFYLFDLPFWTDLRVYILAVVIVTILVYWLVARGWQLRFTLPEIRHAAGSFVSASAGRSGIAFSAGRAVVFPDRAGGAVLSGAVRNGLEPAPVHDRRRLHRRTFCDPDVLGHDRGADRGSGSDHAEEMDPRSHPGGCWLRACVHRAQYRGFPVREAQRNLARTPVHPIAHRSHASRLRDGRACPRDRDAHDSERQHRSDEECSRCSKTCVCGTGGRSTTR